MTKDIMQNPTLPWYHHRSFLLVSTLLLWTVFSLFALHAAKAFNPDAAVYLSTAAIFNQHGLAAAFSSFPHPFYPILIGLVHVGLGTDYFVSAHLINLIAQLLIIIAIFHLAKYLHLKPEYYLWLAAIIIISPVLTEARTFIVRDYGFLAAWIFGVAALIRYAETNKLKLMLAFHVLLIISILFRSDGCVLWLLAPLGLLFYPLGIKKLLYCYSVIFVLGICALIYILSFKHNFIPNNITFYISKYINLDLTIQRYHDLSTTFLAAKAQESLKFILIKIIFYCGLPVYFILHLLNSFNYFLSFFLMFGIASFNKITDRKMFYWIIGIYIFMLAVFFMQNLFFSPRYEAGMSVLLFIPTAFGLGMAWEKTQTYLWLRILIIIVLLAIGISTNWPKPDSRAYQIPAINWLKQQTGIVCTNQTTIAFATTPIGQDYKANMLTTLHIDSRIPSSWLISSTTQQEITQKHCHWIVITTYQGKDVNVEVLKQQLNEELKAKVRFQTEKDRQILWVFERDE